MPLFKVTETRTIYLTHVIEAEDKKKAIEQMQEPGHKGLKDILEDDCEVEYDAEAVVISEQLTALAQAHDIPACEINDCSQCSEYFKLLRESYED